MAEKNNTKQARTITNSMKFLDGYDDETMTNSSYIPESIQPYINQFVRNIRSEFDELTDAEPQYDKSSDEHIAIMQGKESKAKSLITLNNQVRAYKQGISKFKQDLQGMNKGTQDANYFMNSAIYGNQWDDLHIDKNGNFNFLVSQEDLLGEKTNDARRNFNETGEWTKGNAGVLKLEDMENNAIIQEPYGQKSYVFKLAEKTKVERDSGKPFDERWTYNSTLNNLTEAGPNAVIGTAFTDLAGDGQTKSFAEMYDEGLKEEYYVHPDTGETMPEGTTWMKDPANADVLSKLLSKYVTNTMKDMYGFGEMPQFAQDYLKKDRWPGYDLNMERRLEEHKC